MAFAVPHSAVASMVYDLLFQARENDRCPETGPSAANIGRPLPQGLAEFNPLECPSHERAPSDCINDVGAEQGTNSDDSRWLFVPGQAVIVCPNAFLSEAGNDDRVRNARRLPSNAEYQLEIKRE